MILNSPDLIIPTTRPPFIVIDGVNGAGKSTLIRELSGWLQEVGVGHYCTREPGGSTIGQHIRNIVVGQPEMLCPLSEVFLFLADRSHHVSTVIRPHLESGRAVICDRYTYSTVAFQGYGRGLDVDQLIQLNMIATEGLTPDLLLLLDLPADMGLRRANKRVNPSGSTEETDAFEKESVQFHQRIRDGFFEIARSISEPAAIISADRAPEVVLADAKRWIQPLFASLPRATWTASTSGAAAIAHHPCNS
jgi:dTMP kinase